MTKTIIIDNERNDTDKGINDVTTNCDITYDYDNNKDIQNTTINIINNHDNDKDGYLYCS